MPLPRQAEIIWKCTESPDHAQTPAHKTGARGTVEAILVPEDTSKNPEMATFTISGMGKEEQRVPERAEKVITQAQTPSMFFAADQMDSLMTNEKGTLWVDGLSMAFVLLFCELKGRNIIPTMIADKRTLAYMANPSSFDKSIAAPTPLITNGAEGMFIKVRRYSRSDLDSSPRSNNFTAVSAPVGYPQRNPSEMAHAPAESTPNINPRGFLKSEPMSLAEPLTVTREEIIMKGKTAGITVFMQSESPFFIYSADKGEDRIAKNIIPTHKRGRGFA